MSLHVRVSAILSFFWLLCLPLPLLLPLDTRTTGPTDPQTEDRQAQGPAR